jgi:penicillin-binding protein 2
MDIRLQQEADRLMSGRRGAMVAIDPQTGGVLAFVSKPSFDPNLFIDGIDTETWKSLNEDWQRPLINRVTQGLYPPGSTFKPFMGMALLESGKISQSTVVPAPGAWNIPGSRHMFRDSVRSGHGSANLSKAIQVSSDTFFYRLGYELGIDKTAPYLAAIRPRAAQPASILPNEYRGVLPSTRMESASALPNPKTLPPANLARIRNGIHQHRPGLQRLHAAADGSCHRFAGQRRRCLPPSSWLKSCSIMSAAR